MTRAVKCVASSVCEAGAVALGAVVVRVSMGGPVRLAGGQAGLFKLLVRSREEETYTLVVGDGVMHWEDTRESIGTCEPRDVCEPRGVCDSGDVSEDNMADNNMVDNNMVDNNMVDNNMADNNMVDNNMVDNNMADNNMVDNNMADGVQTGCVSSDLIEKRIWNILDRSRNISGIVLPLTQLKKFRCNIRNSLEEECTHISGVVVNGKVLYDLGFPWQRRSMSGVEQQQVSVKREHLDRKLHIARTRLATVEQLLKAKRQGDAVKWLERQSQLRKERKERQLEIHRLIKEQLDLQ
ncbi:putative transmembrane protein [Gregarina niphandrodes]|uniref:Transmembrane protein n=1 Tax=Gregarina niphandrodes TaxID=110365 RepID=A0A023B3U8_GRENI|nr:putative transmembrane protein [Gregarina niphandrodes]EZG55979.1 putative transmembrane protein [Gregarina niphandrodes]|eukprot:XP_011131393.1 putative transmembrane protein [Gregarina niphandrodes]